MALERLTDRTPLTEAPAETDLVHIVDVSDTTDNASGTSKKITVANLLANVQQTTGNKFVGDITLTSGYTYSAWQQNSVINGTTYSTYVADSSITLSAADGSNDRFDVIVFESDNTFDVVEGTAAADPVIPSIDSDTQVIVRIVRVTAASSTESGVTNELVYDEDTGVTTEWNAVSTANVDEANTEQASNGTKSIKFNSAGTSDNVTLTDTSTHDGNLATQIKFKVYLPTSSNYRFQIQIQNQPTVIIQDGVYGFVSSTTASWQQIIIPAADFSGLSSLTYDEIIITNSRNNSTFYIDEFYVVEGFETGSSVPNYTLNLDGTDLQLLKDGAINSVADLSVFASTTQTEFISGFIETPDDQDYKLIVKIPHGGTITETTTISGSGTCTATFKVNTTALGGTANSVSTSEQSQAHASSNTFSADDDIVLTVSSNSSCADMSFTIKYTKTLS